MAGTFTLALVEFSFCMLSALSVHMFCTSHEQCCRWQCKDVQCHWPLARNVNVHAWKCIDFGALQEQVLLTNAHAHFQVFHLCCCSLYSTG